MSGVYFHPAVRDSIGRPPPHLRLAIRPHHLRPFQLQGDCETEIGRWWGAANMAAKAVRAYCRQETCTAFLRIFTRDAELWREEWISVAGKASVTRPVGAR